MTWLDLKGLQVNLTSKSRNTFVFAAHDDISFPDGVCNPA